MEDKIREILARIFINGKGSYGEMLTNATNEILPLTTQKDTVVNFQCSAGLSCWLVKEAIVVGGCEHDETGYKYLGVFASKNEAEKYLSDIGKLHWNDFDIEEIPLQPKAR